MLCLCVNGEIKEVRVKDILKIMQKDKCVQLILKNGSEISVDDTEENFKNAVRKELKQMNEEQKCIKLHLYYKGDKEDYYPIRLPISEIKAVTRSYYSYTLDMGEALKSEFPEEAREKGMRHQPAIITLNNKIKDSQKCLVDTITVYESAGYVMSFLTKAQN